MGKLKEFDTRELSEQGVEIELKNIRTGGGSGIFITIRGIDSQLFDQIRTQQAREAQLRTESGKELTAEERRDNAARMLAQMTIGWRGWDDDDGMEFSEQRAFELYRDYPPIREQVNVEMAKRTNFVKA